MRGSAQYAADELTGSDELVHVDASMDAEPVQHVEHVLSCDIAGCAFRIRATAEAGNRAVERSDAAFEGRVHVRYGLSVRIVKMTGKPLNRDVSCDRFENSLRARGCAGSDRIGD